MKSILDKRYKVDRINDFRLLVEIECWFFNKIYNNISDDIWDEILKLHPKNLDNLKIIALQVNKGLITKMPSK